MGFGRTGMTAWGRIMPDNDIWRVVAFVSTGLGRFHMAH
jgi:mono/diheme cytochrome c family protein